MSIKSELISARARIDTPEKWGKAQGPNRIASSFGTPTMAVLTAVSFLRQFLPDWAYGSLTRFLDDPRTTHSDVLSLFDRAIEEAV